MCVYLNVVYKFFIQCVRPRAIPCPQQPPTNGHAIVPVAKVVLPPLVPLTLQGMKTSREKVPLCKLNLITMLHAFLFRYVRKNRY